MKRRPGLFLLMFTVVTTSWFTAASAETPYERDQREMLEEGASERGLSAQVEQAGRWKKEWREQHPNEPMPSFGALEKLHRGEIIANMRAGFRGHAPAATGGDKRNYQLAKQRQQPLLTAAHVTWTPQQWQQWDRQYDLEQQKRAQDYLKAAELSGRWGGWCRGGGGGGGWGAAGGGWVVGWGAGGGGGGGVWGWWSGCGMGRSGARALGGPRRAERISGVRWGVLERWRK